MTVVTRRITDADRCKAIGSVLVLHKPCLTLTEGQRQAILDGTAHKRRTKR